MSGLWNGKKKKSPRKEFIHSHIPWRPRGTAQRKMETARQKAPAANRRTNADQQNKRAPQIFLFDLKADVGEQNNLAEAKPGMVKNLRCPHGSPSTPRSPKTPAELHGSKTSRCNSVLLFVFLIDHDQVAAGVDGGWLRWRGRSPSPLNGIRPRGLLSRLYSASMSSTQNAGQRDAFLENFRA